MADEERDRKAEQIQALNDLLREGAAELAGLLYDEDREVWEEAGYPDSYDFTQGFSRYERQHVAGRIVDMPAQATWRNEPTVLEEGSDPDEETDFERAWGDLWRRLRLSEAWERLDRMAGIGEFAIQLIGFTDVSGARQLSEEVQAESISDPSDVAFVSQFLQRDVEIADWVTDPSSPHFGRPKSYKVDLSGDTQSFDVGTQEVHRSRVIHLADSPLDDEVFGRPRLKRVLNLLIDLEKITASTGEAYWRLVAGILQAKADPEVSLEAFQEQKEDLEEDVQSLIHGLQRFFTSHGVELEHLTGEAPDPSDAFEMLQTLIAGASGIPKRILFGSERGELASSQDAREWLGRISERQTRLAEPQVVRPFVDRLQGFGALPEVEYRVEWPNLFEHSESELAEIQKQRAQTVKALTEALFQGGDRAARLAAALIPEVEDILEDDMAQMRAFVEETAELEEEEFARLAGNGDGSGPEVPSWLEGVEDR